MNDRDILNRIRIMLARDSRAGQALDALLELRQYHIELPDVLKAVRRSSSGLDEADAPASAQSLPQTPQRPAAEALRGCPHCGCSIEPYEKECPNPACSSHQEAAAPGDSKFKNPVLTFGKYRDKTLLEVVMGNPGYVQWLADNHSAPFWREQAALALLKADSEAPIFRDTSSTGYLG